MANRNDEVRALLRELTHLTTLDEQSPQAFRVRAYENAVHGLEGVGRDLESMTVPELCELRGIGKSTAKKIREYFDTGRVEKLEKLRTKFPPEYVEMSRIPGLGPKTLARVHKALGVKNVADLKVALAAKQLRDLPGLGAKSEEKIGKAIERLGLTGKQRRMPIARAMPIATRLVKAVSAFEGVEKAQYCGSLRRFRETIGDLDIVAAAEASGPIMEAFCALPGVDQVLVRGETKTSVLLSDGLQVDFRVVPEHTYGAATLYFTGSKAHNIKLRMRAMARGMLLNEYGLFNAETDVVVASRTEAEIYSALDLPWIPQSMREDTGEVEAAEADTLLSLLELDELKGDLHVHTELSGDGRSPLVDVLNAARDRGYEYLAITEHAENLVMNGVSRERLLVQRAELAAIQSQYPTLKLLHGIELNIDAEGGLDYDQDFRSSFDWCVAAVHSHFDLSLVQQTSRIVKAMQDPAVNVIGHLTGRMIGRRPGIEIDIGVVLEAAALTGTAIEINCALPRLDAATEVLRRARELGVTLVMSSDAHHFSELSRMQWGVQHAARGWVDKATIANTWPAARFLEWVASSRS